MNYSLENIDIVIGLEVHIQLITNSKLFNTDLANYDSIANENISAITLAHPGTLPRVNEAALHQAISLGLSLNCTINTNNLFSRKHYMYPDLPKGFQTTQHQNPICNGGNLTFNIKDNETTVILDHIHLEEDAGKSIHDVLENYTAIDYNRAGTPLCELVTTPCINSSEEAYHFLVALRKLVRWIGVCDGNLEEGSMRCDANVSIKPKGSAELGTRVEVKNLNSFKNVKKAIDIEVNRMLVVINNGNSVEQETRSFDANTETTFSLRSKEDAMDYRYIIEPDLAPTIIDESTIEKIKANLPELPAQLQNNLIQIHQLSNYDATLLTEDIDYYNLFINCTASYANKKAIVNYINGPIRSYCNEKGLDISEINITPNQIVQALQLVDENKISFNVAGGKLLQLMLKNNTDTPLQLVETHNLTQQADTAILDQWIQQVLDRNSAKVLEYKKGKKGLIGFFMGELVKISKGKADAKTAQPLMAKALEAITL
jgi:aspartyl-tRNA(Asn)/glutamyl-tRNA(Gln) amidotransferase subunit B